MYITEVITDIKVGEILKLTYLCFFLPVNLDRKYFRDSDIPE